MTIQPPSLHSDTPRKSCSPGHQWPRSCPPAPRGLGDHAAGSSLLPDVQLRGAQGTVGGLVSQLRRRGRNPRGTSAQPQEPPGTTTSPGLAAPREGHRLETPGGRGGMGGREAPTRVRTAPASGSRRAPSRASERASRAPRGGARVSHLLPRRSGPRRARCSPGAPHLPLEPHLSLSFLTCSRLSPVLSLTPKWPSTSSTVFV